MCNPSRQQVLRLYKDLIRYGNQLIFTDKIYFLGRIRREFRESIKETNPKTIEFNFKRNRLDYSRFPVLDEADLEEQLTRGSGPGGQAVNKTSNCVLLRHKPTNLIVKCHTHRLASKNRTEARKLLLTKLDEYLNGNYSITAQLKALEKKKSLERKRRQKKLLDIKQKWKDDYVKNA